MSKPRVLQAGRVYPPSVGGVEQVMQLLSEQLSDVCDTEVLVANSRNQTVSEIYNGIHVVRAANMKTVWRMPIALPYFKLFKEMAQDKDIVQLHYPYPIGEAAYLISGYRGKLFVWWHGEIVRQRLVLPLYRPLVKAVLDRADGIMVASEQQIESSQFLQAYCEKCNVVPFGIDVDKWNRVSPDGALRNHLSESSEVILLHVGRLSSPKGLSFLIDAMSKVHGCELFLVGDGELEGELRQQASRIGVLPKVHFLGPLFGDDLAKAYLESDIFVFPTLWDSFGLVQIEAMACGIPVINTMIDSAVPHVSIDRETGITVPPGNSDALASAIQELVDSPERRRSFGEAARKRARERYSIERMLDDVRRIYGV